MELAAKESGTPTDDLSNARRTRFTREQNVFLPNTIAVANLEDPSLANATLPLFMGTGPSGEPTYFIVTEATNFFVAQILGVNYAPKMIFGRGSAGSQEVTLEDGRIKFKGDVNFSPERRVTAGDGPFAFPLSVTEPGSVGDAEYSSLVVLSSGSVINAQIVANNTRVHDRILNIDTEGRTVTFELLDGFQGERSVLLSLGNGRY